MGRKGAVSLVIFTTALKVINIYHPRFTGVETEAQKLHASK